ncbi:MAG: hypothetical protein ACREJ1_10675, partial [Candidatus Methylomirabilales bacterium]
MPVMVLCVVLLPARNGPARTGGYSRHGLRPAAAGKALPARRPLADKPLDRRGLDRGADQGMKRRTSDRSLSVLEPVDVPH